MVESINAIGANAPSNVNLQNSKTSFEKLNNKKINHSEVESEIASLSSLLSEKKVDFNSKQKELSAALQDENISLEFSVDDETNKRVIKFIDVETEEIVKQFPPEVSLKIAKLVSKYKDQGLIVNAKV